MDIYILDELLRRTILVDIYISLIWKERYSEYGAFELVTHNTRENAILFSVDTKITILQSQLVMVVETIEKKIDSDGTSTLTITGRSNITITEDRVAMPALTDLTTNPQWEITGTPGNVVREIFTTICVSGVLNINDVIEFYTAVSLNAVGGIA